jgi:cell division protein FtsQ
MSSDVPTSIPSGAPGNSHAEPLSEPEPADSESAVDAAVESEAALEIDSVEKGLEDRPEKASAEASTAEDETAGEEHSAVDHEGPRRRARRERAERRAAEERATAIEEARREAKRRARGQTGPEPPRLADRTVKGLKLVIWLVLLTVITVVLGLVLYFTPLMSARSLVVIGTGVVPTEEVVQAAAIQMGTPLLQIDTDEVADRVAGIRRVASARVQRQYPSAVRITVIERIPVVVKDFPDGPHLFDRDGVDFVTAPPPPGLAYLDVGNPGPTDPPTKAALEVMTSLRPEVVAQVSRVAAPSVASITLTLTDGRTVVWGTTDRTDEKSEKLAALLTQPGRVYDVSSPDLPTVK